MTMNPFEQSTQQLLRFLTSHAEWEVIDYIRQEIQHDAPDSVPTAEELLTFFQSPDAPTELDTYQQMLVTDMGNIFRDNAPAPAANGVQIDRKRLARLRQKRVALGHKPDDHEPEQQQGFSMKFHM